MIAENTVTAPLESGNVVLTEGRSVVEVHCMQIKQKKHNNKSVCQNAVLRAWWFSNIHPLPVHRL